MGQQLDRKILLASIIELQECIAQEFWYGSEDTCQVLIALQKERLVRVDNTGHGNSGTATAGDGSGQSTAGDF
jgi:hypothetical protein